MEIIAVEKGFSWLLYEDSTRRYILEGMIDLVSKKKPTGFTVTDHKTQSRLYDKYEYNHQALNYLNFTGASYFEYNYIGLQQESGINTFRRPIFKPAAGMLEQWKQDVKLTFDEMYSMVNNLGTRVVIPGSKYNPPDSLFFPRRRSSCTTQFGTCAYHKRCQVPDNSKFVQIAESAYKEKDKRWIAWK